MTINTNFAIDRISLLLKVEHISYAMGTCALPDVYTLALGPQNTNIHLPTTLVAKLN